MSTRNFTFRTIIEPDDPSGYHGFVPALKGVHTAGDTIEEVKENLRDAITLHVQGLIEDGLPVPVSDQTIETIETVSVPSYA